jgi:hypothetical protein
VDDEGQGESEHQDGDEGLKRHTESGAKAMYQNLLELEYMRSICSKSVI